jgi:hypothetical protein
MAESIPWERKNPLLSKLRKRLRNFRAVELQADCYEESQNAPDEAGTLAPTNHCHSVVIIKLTGYWRQK